jgi:RHS repeat-associated protein
VSDYLGTPTHAFDEQGALVWERELDCYGKVRKETGIKGLVPHLYQGQYFDEDCSLAYNRFRYYDCESGGYISQDPIGLAGNNPTLYGYVHDSNTWVDPFGLDAYGANQDVYALFNKADVVNGVPIE